MINTEKKNPYQKMVYVFFGDPQHDRFQPSEKTCRFLRIRFFFNHRRPGTFEATFEKVMQSHVTMSEMNPLGD